MSMRIVFRVDSLNHESRRLRRCLALACGIKETEPGSEIAFLSSLPPDQEPLVSAAGAGLVKMESFGTWDIDATLEELEGRPADLIVLDNPRADEAYLSELRGKGFLAVFDESAALKSYDADAVVNPSLHAHTLQYPPGGAELLLGADFTPLPPSLDGFQEQGRENPQKGKKVLIAFGNDPAGLCIKAVRALKPLGGTFSATVAAGPGFGRGEALASEVGLDPRFNVITDDDPSKRFQPQDICIADPLFLPEILFFSLPSILLCGPGSTEAEYASRSGMARSLPSSCGEGPLSAAAEGLLGSFEERERMSGRMAELVDGLGRFRLAEELLRLCRGKQEPL